MSEGSRDLPCRYSQRDSPVKWEERVVRFGTAKTSQGCTPNVARRVQCCSEASRGPLCCRPAHRQPCVASDDKGSAEGRDARTLQDRGHRTRLARGWQFTAQGPRSLRAAGPLSGLLRESVKVQAERGDVRRGSGACCRCVSSAVSMPALLRGERSVFFAACSSKCVSTVRPRVTSSRVGLGCPRRAAWVQGARACPAVRGHIKHGPPGSTARRPGAAAPAALPRTRWRGACCCCLRLAGAPATATLMSAGSGDQDHRNKNLC